MATTLATIKAQISDEISRGTQLDTKIEARIQMAVRWFERNHNMQYMHRYVDFVLPSTQKAVSIPLRPKRFEFVRYVGTDGVFVHIDHVDPQEVYDTSGTNPSGWWLDGMQYMRFDTEPAADLTIEIDYFQYSADPTGDTAEHWLFDNARDFVVFQTMLYMATVAKSPEWIALYKPMRDEALHTLFAADQEIVQGARDSRTRYTGGY